MEKILEQIDGIIGEAFHLPKSDATDRLLADLEDLRSMVASQHNAHPTLGESATSQAFTNAETLSTSDGVPPSAPARVA